MGLLGKIANVEVLSVALYLLTGGHSRLKSQRIKPGHYQLHFDFGCIIITLFFCQVQDSTKTAPLRRRPAFKYWISYAF